MISSRIIIAILILVVTSDIVEGQYNESHCDNGNWTDNECKCNEYYTGRFCNISCYFESDMACITENCTLTSNNSVLCSCVGAEDAECLFDGCESACSGHGHCYDRPTEGDKNPARKCLCEEAYSGVGCEKRATQTSSTVTQPPQTTTTIATTHVPPVIREPDQANTAYGPYAGGTKVVINGTNLNGIQDVFLHENVTILNRSDEALEIITPPYANASEDISVNISFSYSVEWQTDENIVTEFIFTYKPNPTVSDINPKKAIISGGTSVTVTGNNFDSVASPKFKVYVRKRNNDNDNATLIEIRKKPCELKDKTQLLCRFPKIEPVNYSRRKRFVGKANDLLFRKIREAPTIDQLQFTLGLEFDGVEHYEDLANSNPRLGFIDVHPDPQFESDQKIWFDPDVANVIGIQGEDIDSGTVVEDYSVYIGDAMCTDIGLTFDKLYCSPPENIDDIKDRGPERNLNEANVTVHIGINLRHYVGFITYNTEDPTVPLYTLFIPVVAAIGGVLLILFIILIVCACRKSGVKDEPLTAPSVTDIDNMEPTRNNNYYTGQTTPKEQYYMVVNKDDKRKGSLPPPDKNAVVGRI